MSNIKSYPHYEVNVKDNSIYNFRLNEELPVHRALWVLPTEKGPIGDPVWVSSYKEFRKIFGEQSLNEGNPTYFNRVSWYLKQLLPLNGAFIVRAMPKEAQYASSILEAHVKTGTAVKYHKDDDGFVSKIDSPDSVMLVDTETVDQETGDYAEKHYKSFSGQNAIEIGSLKELAVATNNGDRIWERERSWNSEDETSDSFTYTYTLVSGDNAGSKFSATVTGDSVEYAVVSINGTIDDVTPEAIKNDILKIDSSTIIAYYYTVTPIVDSEALQIYYTNRPASQEEIDKMIGDEAGSYTGAKNGDTYPILALCATNKGAYGNDYGYKFFYRTAENDAATVGYYNTVFNSFSAVRRPYAVSTYDDIADIYGRVFNTFSQDPDCSDPETAIKYGMEPIIEAAFDAEGSDAEEFPYVVYTCEDNMRELGKKVWDAESAESLDLVSIDDTCPTKEDFEAKFADKPYGADRCGYLVNILSGVNVSGVPYEHTTIGPISESVSEYTFKADTDLFDSIISHEYLLGAADIESESANNVVATTKDFIIQLSGGRNGADDIQNPFDDEFLDKSMYDFVKLTTNRNIVDKFRYPFTHVYDIGYSMTTKFAMIDFLDIRDDIGVELTSQVLLTNKWALGASRPIKINDEATDVGNVLVLRERANLCKESVLFNTDCMRCTIYTQAGRPVSRTYNETVPFVFWSAYMHAYYGSGLQMSSEEPRGLDNATNSLFKQNSWKWMPHSEIAKETAWNGGANYCQYGDMTRIFYPALRTVYQHETSVLVDQWVVDSLIYTKHVCRKTWAKFTGRNDPKAILQDNIKKHLENELAFLYNGKYDFSVRVYQTEEENRIGYIQHVAITIVFPATNRKIVFDIEVNREGYTAAAD